MRDLTKTREAPLKTLKRSSSKASSPPLLINSTNKTYATKLFFKLKRSRGGAFSIYTNKKSILF